MEYPSNTPQIRFLEREYDPSRYLHIPESFTIEIIYRAYRQCYSADPFKDGPLSDERKAQIDDYIISHKDNFIGHWFPNIYETESTLETMKRLFGEYALYNHFHRCFFIKSHMNHESCLEHGVITFQIGVMSRSCSHQQVRHRIGIAISQQSQRYVKAEDPDYVLPERIMLNKKAYDIVHKHLCTLPGVITELKQIEDAPLKNEDIRTIFPNATRTEMIVTFNYRALLHYFSERCCTCAEKEIRSIANRVLTRMKIWVPIIFDDAGPKCMQYRICPESKERSCHRFITKEELFERMEQYPEIFAINRDQNT